MQIVYFSTELWTVVSSEKSEHFQLRCCVCRLKRFTHLYQLPNFEFGLYSSMWARIWPSEDLKLRRYFESCLQTTAISDTCYEEGLQSKPSVTMHAKGLFSLANGT